MGENLVKKVCAKCRQPVQGKRKKGYLCQKCRLLAGKPEKVSKYK